MNLGNNELLEWETTFDDDSLEEDSFQNYADEVEIFPCREEDDPPLIRIDQDLMQWGKFNRFKRMDVFVSALGKLMYKK